jgi:hypothetical protein
LARTSFPGRRSFNKAVVAAFERYLGVPIAVPPDHDVTGAIGMALLAREQMRERGSENRQSSFKGFELSKKPYEISSFECRGCPNVCEINRVKVQDEGGYLFYGGRCEKYDVWHRRRILEVKPGITGLWQVMGRSSTTFDEMVRLDLRYVKNWSLALDLKILFWTPLAVVKGRGAY